MRDALLFLGLATAAAYGQVRDPADAPERVRRAVVRVETVDRALLRAQRLRRQRATVRDLHRVRIHQPYRMLVAGVAISGDGEIVAPAVHPRADLRVTVTFFDGTQAEAEIVGTDPRSNLALLRAENGTRHFLAVEDLVARTGEDVRIVGHVFQRGTAKPLAVDGRVTREHLPVRIADAYGVTSERRITLDSVFAIVTTTAYPASGSVCVDGEGRLLGLVTGNVPPRRVRDEDEPAQVHIQQLQFAVPAVRIARIVDDLREHGRVVRAHFGLRFAPLGDEVRAHFPKLPPSACAISQVQPKGPAAKAGLRLNDILLCMDGRNYRDGYELGQAMSDKQPGEPVTFRVLRRGEVVEVTATPVEQE